MKADAETVPTLTMMQRRMHEQVSAIGPTAVLTRLGTSAQGRPIELVSIGQGARSALLVGAPHPNEPIGCITIAKLVDRLANDRDFRDNSGFRWHFIQSIDVDGLALNESWFERPRTIGNYLEGFFRPALALQPEYSFPIDLPGYRFGAATPENLCWQRALELTKPDLQCSLHGADIGGVFYIMSQHRPELAETLQAQPGMSGLPLNSIGEPFSDMEQYAPGVFGFPPITAMIAAAVERGRSVDAFWNAGRSSAEYAAERYGTFSLTCEVPLWDDERLHEEGISNLTMADVVRRSIVENNETQALLATSLPDIRDRARTADQRALLAALEEALHNARHQAEQLTQLLNARPDWSKPLPTAMLACIEDILLVAGMRAPAMLARIAEMLFIERTRHTATMMLAHREDVFLKATKLRTVSFEAAAELQLQAILAAAESI